MTLQRNPQNRPLPELAFCIRAVTLALGESARPQWWATQFLNETGMRFLERLYPRSAFHAAIYAAGRAACDTHDKAVGRIGVYHLFRMPEPLESEIARVPPDFDPPFLLQLRSELGSPDKLMALLGSMSGGLNLDMAAGARRIGIDRDAATPSGLRKMAAVYQQAFRECKPAFPYFTAEDRD